MCYHAEALVSTSQLIARTQARHTTLAAASDVDIQTTTQKWDKSIVWVLFIVSALHPPPFDLAVNTGGSNERDATKRNGKKTERERKANRKLTRFTRATSTTFYDYRLRTLTFPCVVTSQVGNMVFAEYFTRGLVS